MGDRTPFQCAMIYNDQKDYDWFHPWLSQYGRTKRRTVGNRQQRFLSSANAITARPESADKPSKGTPPAACPQNKHLQTVCCGRWRWVKSAAQDVLLLRSHAACAVSHCSIRCGVAEFA